jgi:hypothetical protein
MRMLFSSSDITEIGRVGREFVEAGIPCGVRYDPPREGACPTPGHAELWVQSESDFHRAVTLYLRLAGRSDARTTSAAPRYYPTPAFGTVQPQTAVTDASRPAASA